jgi:hypothetical protein
MPTRRGDNDFTRIGASRADGHAASQYTPSAGFGSTAAVTLDDCNDTRGNVTVTCGGTGQGASPTLAVVYSRAYEAKPRVVVCRAGGSQPTINFAVTSESATGFTVTFNGTASGSEAYKFNYVVMG